MQKIRGKLHYFGKWDNPQGALDLYAEQRDDLSAGRTPRPRNWLRPTKSAGFGMILLGTNCGLGNADCGQLPETSLDLKGGWLDFPRPKTGIARRCALWPETVTAIREVIAHRTAPKDDRHKNLVFVTKYGQPWFKGGSSTNPVSQQFRKLLVELNVYREGIGFYALRHTFETVAGESKDQVAVNHIMGHVDDSMAGEYREHISDVRLRAVTDHVHAWLFSDADEQQEISAEQQDAEAGDKDQEG